MEQYDNLWADLSAGSGYNAITRDEAFGLTFLERFQDKLMFGTDSCRRFVRQPELPNVDLMTKLKQDHLISDAAWAKIASGNAIRLMGL